jgi:uncharacterized protein YpiB (UPF0302 family)
MNDIKKLLKILKSVIKYTNENKTCNLGYLLKHYKLEYDECIWILERICKKPKRIIENHKGDIVFLEI